MNVDTCVREPELLDALGRGYVGAELTEHVDACAACSELRLVAGALLDEKERTVAEAPVPSAGTMWFRMQMRRRRDAQSIARRVLVAGQAATLLVALTLVISFFGADLAAGVRHMRDVVASLHLGTWTIVGIASSLLIAPIAGWMALRDS